MLELKAKEEIANMRAGRKVATITEATGSRKP